MNSKICLKYNSFEATMPGTVCGSELACSHGEMNHSCVFKIFHKSDTHRNMVVVNMY